MTTTNPRRGPSTPSPVGGPPRACHLYRFWVRHPTTGARVLGYIGETGRMPFTRLMEHIERQPWADTILGWEVDPQTHAGKVAVLAAEQVAIETERPLYNVEWNMTNPDRIPPWDQKRQRAERDAAHGLPVWQPTRTVVAEPARPDVAVRVLTSRWTWVAAVYLAAVAAGWSVLGHLVLSWRWHLAGSAALPLLLAGAGYWWWRAKGRRRWRRLTRRR